MALQSQVTCDGCGATFTRYTFGLVASLGAGDDSVSARPPVPRMACPECGRPIETEPLEPL